MIWSIIGAAAFSLYSIGTEYGYVAFVGSIAAASPVIAVILGITLLKERIEKHQAVGIALAIIGVVFIAL